MRFLVSLAVWLCLIALILGWFGGVHAAFDSLAHFRLHLLAGLFCAMLLLVMMRRWPIVFFSTIVATISLWLTAPHLPALPVTPVSSGNKTIRVAQLNLLFNNPQLEKAHNLLAGLKADFILLQEVTRHTGGVLDRLKSQYPHQHLCKYMGVAIVSRHPKVQSSKPDCVSGLGFGSARFRVGGREITLASIHLSWPWPRGQHRQIDRLTPHLNEIVTPLVIAGDFNAAPWSDTVRRTALMSKSNVAPGFTPSWAPARLKAWASKFGLPIDNTLYSKELRMVSRRTLGDAGSDHLPVLTVFQWVQQDGQS